MASTLNTATESRTGRKRCTICFQEKETTEFCRSRGNNPPAEYTTCNQCSQRRKEQQETDKVSRKKQKLETDLHASVPTICTALTRTSSASSSASITPVSNTLEDLELLSENCFQIDDDGPLTEAHIETYDTDSGGLLYTLDEMQQEVSKQFQEAENSDKPATLAVEVELDSLESIF